MRNESDIKIDRFWEKYEVLENFNRDYYRTRHPLSREQFIKFLDEVYKVWRAQPSSQPEIDGALEMKIQRQAILYRLAQKGR